MKKYRILTDGQKYKAQIKFLFWWIDFKCTKYGDDGFTYKEVIETKTAQSCMDVLSFVLSPRKEKRKYDTVVMEFEL